MIRKPATTTSEHGSIPTDNGRWLSADWSAVPVAVPYATLANPQTLNLYAMVGDDPETSADLDGHCPDGPGCLLQAVEVLSRFADNPVGFTKSFLTAAGKQALTNSYYNNVGIGVPLAPSNGVERAGAATLNTVGPGLAVVLPLVTGAAGEEGGTSFMGPKMGSSGGSGARKDFTPSVKQEIVDENVAANAGTAKCVFCGVKVTTESSC